MAEKMIRTQVYLPKEIYDELRQRAKKYRLTLAVQIREALEVYIRQAKRLTEEEPILRADDPIFEMIGMYDSGVGDLSVNHDHYLYGAPKQEPFLGRSPTRVKEKAKTAYKPKAKKTARRRKTR